MEREALLPLSAIHLCFAVMDYVYSKSILVANPVCSVLQRLKSLHLQSAERVAYQKRQIKMSYKKLSSAVMNI